MPSQANIVSFDAARRAATGTRAPGSTGRARAGRILIGGDQSAIVDDLPGTPSRRGRASALGGASARAVPSWYERPAADDDVFARPAPRRASRFADDDSLDDYEERLERSLPEEPSGAFGRFRSRSAEKRRERTKERADRAYFRQYEAGASAESAAGGPRAAVYKGEMGASHKRSSRMQQQASVGSSRSGKIRGGSTGGSSLLRPSVATLAVTALCLVCAVAFLYSPAQQLYLDIREKDRLSAEYAAVVERNEAINAQVEALNTDAGIEDMARTQLGWVKEGEHAVSVGGLEKKDASKFRGNIVSEDIEPPDTWYSGVLDPIFGVS